MVDVEPAVQWAVGQVGTPYVSVGGATPGVNLDCSGLVMRAFQQVGINMPHSTFQQINYGVGVSKAQLQRGDLVFPDPGHVQIYLGNGMIVESPHPGARVRITQMWGFYAARHLGTASGSPQQTIVTTPVLNPMDAVNELRRLFFGFKDSVTGVFDSAEKPFKWLAQSHNWYRLLLIGLGVVLLAIAFRMLLQTETLTLVKKTTDAL
jgi:hypothetical protein